MKRFVSLLLFITLFQTSFGQVINKNFKVAYYADNIIKVTVTPADVKAGNKNISDAVILKPVMLSKKTHTVSSAGTDLIIDGTLKIALSQSNGYKGLTFPLTPNEAIFGGGERALPLNRRGYRLTLYNQPAYGYGEGAVNLNYSVPFITSSKGYGLFFDNPSKGYLDIGKTNPQVLEYGAYSGEVNVYIIFGNYQQILESYYKLTGTQPLPPRWALGNLMSRFGYTSEAQTKEILGKMKAENIPVDAVIFDLFWFGDSIKGTLGNLDWINKSKWPAPKKMITDFKKDGIQTILVTEPFLVETSKNYIASKPYLAVDSSRKPYYLTDFYFGKGGLIDIFRRDVQSWFWQFYKKQMDNGVEAWWGDLGEPERHPSDMYHNLKDQGQKRLFSANEVHNIYGHNWTKMLYNKYATNFPNKRLFSLNRAGFAGSQHYSIFPWTGDVGRNWSGLRAQLPVLLGMSMSGVPYVHSDAGGFAGGDGDNELYVRWLQFAAFTPIFRPHGTALYEVDSGAASFPSEAALINQPYRDYAKEVIRQRYEMLPYNYSLAYAQAKWGKPLMAPLYYYYAGDTTASGIQNEYMWGENLLVAPVLEKGLTYQEVYLPKGEWIDWDGKKWSGEQVYAVPVPLQRIPVFVKAGGFIPRYTLSSNQIEISNTATDKNTIPTLYYVPSTQASNFTWYLDDGVSKNAIATGKYTLVECRGQERNGKINVSVTASNKLFLKDACYIQIGDLDEIPKTIRVNGKSTPVVAIGSGNSSIESKTSIAQWKKDKRSLEIQTYFGAQKSIQIEIEK